MSDLNVTVATPKSVETSKDGVVLPSKGQSQATEPQSQSKSAMAKKPIPVGTTDLNYSIDHENNALHLKVKRGDGELVREVVFERIDPGLLNTKKLKGIFVDGNS